MPRSPDLNADWNISKRRHICRWKIDQFIGIWDLQWKIIGRNTGSLCRPSDRQWANKKLGLRQSPMAGRRGINLCITLWQTYQNKARLKTKSTCTNVKFVTSNCHILSQASIGLKFEVFILGSVDHKKSNWGAALSCLSLGFLGKLLAPSEQSYIRLSGLLAILSAQKKLSTNRGLIGQLRFSCHSLSLVDHHQETGVVRPWQSFC